MSDLLQLQCKRWTQCESKCDDEGEEVAGEVGSVIPGDGYVGKFGDGGSDHDYGGYHTTKRSC